MRHLLKTVFLSMIIGLFVMLPTSSYAVWNGHDGNRRGHDGGHHDSGHGHSFVGINFSVWPNNYYYASYYQPVDEVLVSPPIYQPVIINGITYYLNNGTYYVYNGYNYQAIAPPVTVIQQQPVTSEEPPETVDSQAEPAAAPVITPAGTTSDTAGYMAITVNIPNNKGGYTAVTLKKSGNGFTGPQGEFYVDFPKVSQLEIMYGK